METVTVEIDSALASEYFHKYGEVLEMRGGGSVNFQDFLRSFVEDRLREEIDFLENEMA